MKSKSKGIFKGKIGADAKTQDEATLAKLLKDHDDEGFVPFHMPGHKRNKNFEYLSGVQKMDITELEGFDNLHAPKDLLIEAQKRAAEFFCVKESRYLINGATGGILAAMRAMTKFGDGVLIARNCHKSVFNGVELCGLKPHYVMPAYFEEYGFYGSVMPEDVEKQLLLHTDIKLVVITSPTYEGVLSDIKSIAALCRKHNALLLVDEAHGAHLGLCRSFEQSARNLGADVVVNSLHKTLPSLTQTAVLHICSDRVSVGEIDRALSVFESSSPSYVLMSSIDECIRYLSSDGAKTLDRWADMVDKFRRSTARNKRIKLFNGDREGRVFAYDDTKLVFLTVECALSGISFMRLLRKNYKIELEMAAANYAVAMTGAGDDLNAFLALSGAVYELETSVRERYGLVNINNVDIPQKVFEPYQIRGLNAVFAEFDESAGYVAAENVWAYPPGCPLICKGEVITTEFLHHSLVLYQSGIEVDSEQRAFPNKILVVAHDPSI